MVTFLHRFHLHSLPLQTIAGMLLVKTLLVVLMAAVICATSTLARISQDPPVKCQTLCSRQEANNICGNNHPRTSLVPLKSDINQDPRVTVKVLIGKSMVTEYQVTGRFDQSTIGFTTKGGPDGPFLFDIVYDKGLSATYKLSSQYDTCEQAIPDGATTLISGNALYTPLG